MEYKLPVPAADADVDDAAKFIARKISPGSEILGCFDHYSQIREHPNRATVSIRTSSLADLHKRLDSKIR